MVDLILLSLKTDQQNVVCINYLSLNFNNKPSFISLLLKLSKKLKKCLVKPSVTKKGLLKYAYIHYVVYELSLAIMDGTTITDHSYCMNHVSVFVFTWTCEIVSLVVSDYKQLWWPLFLNRFCMTSKTLCPLATVNYGCKCLPLFNHTVTNGQVIYIGKRWHDLRDGITKVIIRLNLYWDL